MNMKINKFIASLAAVLFLFLGSVRAQQPAPPSPAAPPAEQPKAVPVTAEPRHHLSLENAFVRAFRVEVAPKDSTLLHEHARDYVYVALGPADIVNAVLGKPEVHAQLADAEVRFARGNFSHIARNLSDQPFRNLTIEFVEPQGAARNLCAKIVPGDAGPCQETARNGFSAKPLFETDNARVELAKLDAATQKAELAATGRGLLLAALDQAAIKIERDGQPPMILTTGGMLWLPAGSRAMIANLRDAPSNLLLIFFPEKEKTPAPH
jgi:quercetin dioxygenase-like cupin family protein